MGNPFKGRSLSVVRDFSVDEQRYLYEETRKLKEAIRSGGDLSRFKIADPDLGIYLLFLEDSTRTKESFRNAAKFHGGKVNNFDANSSSFNKKESITDTVKMLFGYSNQSMFIIRSSQEGVCSWLSSALGKYAETIGYPVPTFLNAGDGKHEHPTQEFLDEYSFLEQMQFNSERIHIALVGDLWHGRTVHSKADGLRVFHDVTVDLVAPEELRLPDYYIQRMKDNGFQVRIFESIEAYLSQKKIAPIWYFTRLQLERMGDKIRDKEASLREAVTFSRKYSDRVLEGTKFYHPLPRHRVHPTIPTWLDHTELNGWDRQSVNGYYTRIIEMALLYGRLGDDFSGESVVSPDRTDDFVTEATAKAKTKPEYKVGIKPVDNGIVIDHIGKGTDLKMIWNHIDKIRQIMGLNFRSSHGVYHTDDGQFKGIISLPDILSFDERQIKMLGAIAPGCTLNIISNGGVQYKYRLGMPPRIYNFDEISCKNESCISYPEFYEGVRPEFYRSGQNKFVCKYCEKPHSFEEIWDV